MFFIVRDFSDGTIHKRMFYEGLGRGLGWYVFRNGVARYTADAAALEVTRLGNGAKAVPVY